MSVRLFPYKVPVATLRLTVRDLRIDGGAPGRMVTNVELCTVDLHELDLGDWRRATLEIVAELTAGSADHVAGIVGDPVVVVVAHCKRTNMRRAMPLARSSLDPHIWSGHLHLDRVSFQGSATLQVTLSGAIEGRPDRIALRSDTWDVRVDRPERNPIGGAIPMRWERFSEPSEGHGQLKTWESEAYFLELSGDEPVLYLNSELEDLPKILSEEKHLNTEKALQLAVAGSMAAKVWFTMFTSAIGSVAATSTDDGEPIAMPSVQWQQQALTALLSLMYDDRSVEDALADAVARIRTPDGAQVVYAEAMAAAQRKVESGRKLRKALEYVYGD